MSIRKSGRSCCPQCGSTRVVPIVYGYPSEGACQAADKGEIHLGGCCTTGDDPDRHCPACGHQWRREGAAEPLDPHEGQGNPYRSGGELCCGGVFFAQVGEGGLVLECSRCGLLWRMTRDGQMERVS